MAKPLEEWTPDELRTELGRLTDELARRAEAPVPAKAAKGRVDVAKAAENWVLGHAWDETFSKDMVDEELSILERKTGQELGPLDRERLVRLWLDEYDRRHRAA